MIKQHPILFSPTMVNALLAGTKSQTRRIIQPAPVLSKRTFHEQPAYTYKHSLYLLDLPTFPTLELKSVNPYGKIGDLLWVRENFKIGAWDTTSNSVAIDYQADGEIRKEWIPIPNSAFQKYQKTSFIQAVKAGILPDSDYNFKWDPGNSPCKWRPSIHMRKEFARIWLQITDLTCERLNDISKEDAIAEGIEPILEAKKPILFRDYIAKPDENFGFRNPIDSFQSLIKSINGDLDNPWLWVVKFKIITTTGHIETTLKSI